MVTRRDFIKAGAASGALLFARPWSLTSWAGISAAEDAGRISRLFPGSGLRLAHADMHNHSAFSGGSGDPANAYASMRGNGIDVAAMTEHATLGRYSTQAVCLDQVDCTEIFGIDEEIWQQMAVLADAADDPGSYTAIRGFEWSSPSLGHMNVWFSSTWIDPLHTAGATSGEGAGQFLHDNGEEPLVLPRDVANQLDGLVRQAPTTGTEMQVFYDWLAAPASRPVVGGGDDGLIGFNHPGREVGRFGYFEFQPKLSERIVSLETFNRRDDYLFEGTDSGVGSPINECLNAGWRVGFLGVTDEHGTEWGLAGKGRTGMWVSELTRAGVREAMLARRFFSTRLKGLRIDASARSSQTGALAQMGGTFAHQTGTVTFELDIDHGPDWHGKPLVVQVLGPGTFMPEIKAVRQVVVPSEAEPVISFTADIDVADAPWVFLRISDPAEGADGRATGDWEPFGNAVAYASPFFLDPRYSDSAASKQKRAALDQAVAAAIPFQHPAEHTHSHAQASHHGHHHHGAHSHTH
jgi:hypothetical protein